MRLEGFLSLIGCLLLLFALGVLFRTLYLQVSDAVPPAAAVPSSPS